MLEVCLDRATEVLFSGLERSVFVTTEPSAVPGEEVRIRLAGLLPGLARWSQLALNGLPNELVNVSLFYFVIVAWCLEADELPLQSLLDVREVSCLSAITFSKFEDRFR